MSIFFKAEEKIRTMIDEYLTTVENCLKAFNTEITPCFEPGSGKLLPHRNKTHKFESKADDIRREIAMMLFGRTLLPESRGDIMGVLEAIDKIPNAAETVLSCMETERIYVPEEFKPQFLELVEANMEAFQFLMKCAQALFTDPKQTLYFEKEVDIRESASDRMERKLISEVYDTDMEKADKIILRDLINHISAISDRAENAADRLGLTAIRRRI
ncbi:MAG: DUF47 family protein [Elusimicrobiota bacterium]